MPGPMSDSYDPEWGTAFKKGEIGATLAGVYDEVTSVLGGVPPIYIGDLVNADLPRLITATFSEKDWRLIRFALERARESL